MGLDGTGSRVLGGTLLAEGLIAEAKQVCEAVLPNLDATEGELVKERIVSKFVPPGLD